MTERTSTLDKVRQFEHLFPTYTGSMTALIESSFGNILLTSLVLAQSNEPVEGFLADIAVAHGFEPGKMLSYRRALLTDAVSEKKYLYASTLINISAFPVSVMRQMQEHPSEPLGRIITGLPLEKTLLSAWHRRDDPFLMHLFSDTGTSLFHGRRMLFTLYRRAGMLLEEVIPCRCATSCPLMPQQTPSNTLPLHS